jgi:hypothetical protein
MAAKNKRTEIRSHIDHIPVIIGSEDRGTRKRRKGHEKITCNRSSRLHDRFTGSLRIIRRRKQRFHSECGSVICGFICSSKYRGSINSSKYSSKHGSGKHNSIRNGSDKHNSIRNGIGSS